MSAPAADAPMRRNGTLRQRGTLLFLEPPPRQDAAQAAIWAMPRIYRVLITPATQAAVAALVDDLVTVTGKPVYSDTRYRTFVVLASVEPLGRPSNDERATTVA